MSPPPRIGVLALQGDVREHLRSLDDCGAHAVAVGSAAQLGTIDGLVIPGGESTTMSKLARADGLLDPLRQARAAGLPIFGSCAGLIMLADRICDGRADQETIGGLDITARRNAFGSQIASFEAELDIPIIGPEPYPGVFIRAPQVEAAGPGVEILARLGDRGGGTIVAVRQGRLLGTAFHPELTEDLRIHQMFVEIVQMAREP